VYRLKQGDRIMLHSLSTASYNGKYGTVEGFNSDRGRWTVNLDDGSQKGFELRKMHFISEFNKGDRVLLHHLSTASLNGKLGTIDKPFLTKRARWSVMLDDGKCRNVKSSKLRLATESDEEAAKLAAEAEAAEKGAEEMEVDGEQGDPTKNEEKLEDEKENNEEMEG